MNFGQNLYNALLNNAGPLFLGAMIVLGIVIFAKREFSKLPGFFAIAILGSLLVYNASGVKDFLLNIGNALIA